MALEVALTRLRCRFLAKRPLTREAAQVGHAWVRCGSGVGLRKGDEVATIEILGTQTILEQVQGGHGVNGVPNRKQTGCWH
jgi:hypothetical protein